MKIYVLNFRSVLIAALVFVFAVCIVVAAVSLKTEVMDVFNSQKELPIYSVEVPEKKLAITFDCAWGADDIPDILKILREEGVRATFFLVGQWAQKYPDSVKQIAAGGHDVANHSWSHPKMGSLGSDAIREELTRCTDFLEQLTGKRTNLFRAPYGDYSDTVIRTARELGYYTIQWDVDSLDWKPEITPETIRERIRSKVQNGSILLFHNDTAHTAHILRDIIKELRAMGYSFAPVSELIIKEDYIIDFTGRQKKKQN